VSQRQIEDKLKFVCEVVLTVEVSERENPRRNQQQQEKDNKNKMKITN
jgi:hypothetical protein